MTTKEKMSKIKEMLNKSEQKKISKKELIDKVYADLEAKEAKNNDITEEDMKILQAYANSQGTENEKTKSTDELSEEAQKALKDYFAK